MSNSWGKPKKLTFAEVDTFGGVGSVQKLVRWTCQGSVDMLHIDEVPSEDFNGRSGTSLHSFFIDDAISIYEILKDYFDKDDPDWRALAEEMAEAIRDWKTSKAPADYTMACEDMIKSLKKFEQAVKEK